MDFFIKEIAKMLLNVFLEIGSIFVLLIALLSIGIFLSAMVKMVFNVDLPG